MNKSNELFNLAFDIQNGNLDIAGDNNKNLLVAYYIYNYILEYYSGTSAEVNSIYQIGTIAGYGLNVNDISNEIKELANKIMQDKILKVEEQSMIKNISNQDFIDTNKDTFNNFCENIQVTPMQQNSHITDDEIIYSKEIEHCSLILWRIAVILSILFTISGLVVSIITESFLIFLISIFVTGITLFFSWIIKILIMGYSIIVKNSEEAIEERKK